MKGCDGTGRIPSLGLLKMSDFGKSDSRKLNEAIWQGLERQLAEIVRLGFVGRKERLK